MDQRSLFPDGFEVEEDALDALESLEVARGLACVAEARRRAPDLTNLDDIESALAWIEIVQGRRPPDGASAAAAFLALPAADLPEGAAAFADQAIARFGLRVGRGRFLDPEQRVPLAALRLVLRRTDGTRRELSRLLAEAPDRPDLWGVHGDACLLDERADEANESYVRALLLGAARVDLFRLRENRLRLLLAELRAGNEDACSRELLFVHAWLRGILAVPANNGWLDAQTPRLRAHTAIRGTPDPASRARRFALLLYLDRSRKPGDCEVAEREEMQALDPELFERFVAVLRERRG